MTSLPQQRLIPGEKELAKELRVLVEPLRKQFDTKEEQAVCFQRFGKIYLQAAIESKDGNYFMKASALFNAALVRTSTDEVELEIKKSIVKVRQEFVASFYPEVKPMTLEQWEQIRKNNKLTLENIRTKIRENSRRLENEMIHYNMNHIIIAEVEAFLVDEAKRLSLQVQEQMLLFVDKLWQQCIISMKSQPPCDYSVIGLGSLARQEVTPYSDLEFAILVNEQSNAIERYFKNLNYLFHLTVLDIGETPIPQMAIPSLNDFTTQTGDWFFDKITPSGFKLDGAMPWACKIPTGGYASSIKMFLSLIRTPNEMALLLKEDNELGQSYRVAEVLGRTIHISGNPKLHTIYEKEVKSLVDKSGADIWKKRGLETITDDLRKSFSTKISLSHYDAKSTYYRLPSAFVESMRLCLIPHYQGGSQWCLIDHLVKMEKFSKEEALEIEVYLALTYGIRLLTYFTNGGQFEKVDTWQLARNSENKQTPLINKDIHKKLKNVEFYIMDILETKLGHQVQLWESLKGVSYEPKPFKPSPLNCYFELYFNMALTDRNEHLLTCRHFEKMCSWGGEGPDLSKTMSLIQNTERCACVRMIKSYLEVHEYCLLRANKITGFDYPSYSAKLINGLLGELLPCTKVKVRDRVFLTFCLLKLAWYSTDLKAVEHIATLSEEFVGSISGKCPKSSYQKAIFHRMEGDFTALLIDVYMFLGERGKKVKLLEKLIKPLEKCHPNKELDLKYLILYKALATELFDDQNRQEEAISLFESIMQKYMKESHNYDDFIEEINKLIDLYGHFLSKVKRFEEIETSIGGYYFGNKKSPCITDEHILIGMKHLHNCYDKTEQFEKAIRLCETIHQMMGAGRVGGQLSVRDRMYISCRLVDYYLMCAKLKDVPKVAQFHSLLCRTQTVEIFGEHVLFLLYTSLNLFCNQFNILGIHYLLKAYDLVKEKLRRTFDLPATLFDMLVILCDQLQDIIDLRSLALLVDINIWMYDILRYVYSNRKDVNILYLCMCQMYLEYRLSFFLVNYAIDPHTCYVLNMWQTIEYLYQTQTNLKAFFPKCSSATKWLKHAISEIRQKYHIDKTLILRMPQPLHIRPDGLINVDRGEGYLNRIV